MTMVGYSTINSWPHLLPPLSDPHVLQIVKAKGRSASQAVSDVSNRACYTLRSSQLLPVSIPHFLHKTELSTYVTWEFSSSPMHQPLVPLFGGLASLGVATRRRGHSQGQSTDRSARNGGVRNSEASSLERIRENYLLLDFEWPCER